jgi:hypothetical protein
LDEVIEEIASDDLVGGGVGDEDAEGSVGVVEHGHALPVVALLQTVLRDYVIDYEPVGEHVDDGERDGGDCYKEKGESSELRLVVVLPIEIEVEGLPEHIELSEELVLGDAADNLLRPVQDALLLEVFNHGHLFRY